MQVRRATPADIPAIFALERHTPTAAHWSQPQYEDIFAAHDPAGHSERFAWVAEDVFDRDNLKAQTSIDTPKILAFLIAHRCVEEWELENIVVAETTRGRGLGTLMLREFIAKVRAAGGSSIFLEVRQSNRAARSLYRKLGFQETGSRKNYYENPAEDAVVYSLALN